MQEVARGALADLIQKYGFELTNDARRLEALLRDNANLHQRDIAVLIGAAREGIPRELLDSGTSLPIGLRKGFLVERLRDNLALDADAARWAVEAWAQALAIETPRAEIDLGEPNDRANGAWTPIPGHGRDKAPPSIAAPRDALARLSPPLWAIGAGILSMGVAFALFLGSQHAAPPQIDPLAAPATPRPTMINTVRPTLEVGGVQAGPASRPTSIVAPPTPTQVTAQGQLQPTQQPTPTPRGLTPEEWVRSYYEAINQRRFADAYSIFSRDARRRQSLDQFQTQFADLINITVRYVDHVSSATTSDTASLDAHTTTVYQRNGAPVTECWTVQWQLVFEDGNWRRHDLSQQRDACATHP